MEINLIHGDPLDLADQVFLFKRTAREAALRHKMYATFMAKPHAKEPGSAMHIHQSVVDTKTAQEHLQQPGRHALAAVLLRTSPACRSTCRRRWRCSAPNVNSYRRLTRYLSAPDQRAVGLRQPHRRPARADVRRRRRAASRTASAAPTPTPTSRIAASLACGYLGMVEGLQPSRPDRRQRARPAVRPAALAR